MAERYTAENLTFTRSGRTLTDNVSLSLSQGELVTLIGPNGAGKSTLLRLLTGYLKPDSGGCSLAGKALDEWHPQTLSRYRAVMRQQSQPGFDWQVEEIVGMGRAPWTRHPEPSIVREVLQLTGCLPLAGRRYHALSGASNSASSSPARWRSCGVTERHAAGCFSTNPLPRWISTTSSICCAC